MWNMELFYSYQRLAGNYFNTISNCTTAVPGNVCPAFCIKTEVPLDDVLLPCGIQLRPDCPVAEHPARFSEVVLFFTSRANFDFCFSASFLSSCCFASSAACASFFVRFCSMTKFSAFCDYNVAVSYNFSIQMWNVDLHRLRVGPEQR